MIALSHRTHNSHTVLVRNDAQAPELFDLAQRGDTLHIISPCASADEVLKQIVTQLANGQGKVL